MGQVCFSVGRMVAALRRLIMVDHEWAEDQDDETSDEVLYRVTEGKSCRS
jgi:hypothetical protein